MSDEDGTGTESADPAVPDPQAAAPETVPADTTAGDGGQSAASTGEDPAVEQTDHSDQIDRADPAAAAATIPENETRRQRRRREKAAKPRRKAPWWELPALVVLAIGVAILVKTFVVQPFYIPSDSMEQTLHGCPGCRGDRILVNKPIFDLRDPHPGDIVVFNDPAQWNSDDPATHPPSNPVLRAVRGFGQLVGFVPPDGQVLVKRVIAVGGQTVKGVDGRVMISTHGAQGPYRTLSEPYVYLTGTDATATFGPVTVPKGRLWVMGDHRNDSADSRYHCQADIEQATNESDCDPVSSTVPVGDVIGKAFVIAWPPSRWRTLGTPSTFQSAASATAPALPAAVSMATVVPVFLVRRRRRR